jgi:phosphoesterase RecJ-like protein
MKELTRTECADWLLDRDHFVILTHRKPDGDTLGSSAALCRGLRALGKTAHLLENNEVTPLYAPLVEGLTKAAPEEGDILVAVDVAADNMLPKAFEHLKNNIDLRIDHHGSGREYTPNEHVDSESAACAEIIWELLLDMGVDPDEKMAEAVYVGVSTDTGCFRFANTTTHTFQVAAACAATGAKLQPINQALFDTISLNKLKVQAWVTANTHFFCEGKGAVCAMPANLAQELGVEEDEVGGMSGFIRSIEGVCMSGTLREDAEGKVFLSTRGIPGYDCARVCGVFGGGGHKGAAGGSTTMPLAEAKAIMIAEMTKQLEA